ncbi:MAG: arginine repressor [Peptostreptococcaceae bacterium]|nr:arginine repressor [Peptostreptococcaceae bacterium]
MRYSRQNRILGLIKDHEIETQEKLAYLLKEDGFDVTQATVSRDIKELQLIKSLSSSGKYKYALGVTVDAPITDRFVKIFKDTIISVASSGNLIVIKTLTGCANAAAEAIDSLSLPFMLGTIAGDNTILIIVDDEKNVLFLQGKFNELLG